MPLHTVIACIKSWIPESRPILLGCDMHIITYKISSSLTLNRGSYMSAHVLLYPLFRKKNRVY